MKKIILPFLILTSLIQFSCVTSWQPLVTYNTAIADNRLTGTWNSEGQDYIVEKVFDSPAYKKQKNEPISPLIKKGTKDSILYSKSYIIRYTKDKIEYHFFCSMIKINSQVFMNITVADITSINNGPDIDELNLSQNWLDRLHTYTIAHVQFSNTNTIKLNFIDGSFIYDQIKKGRMKLKHESDDLYDTFLITASPAEMQQFIQKYGNDDRFFNKENSVTLIRKS